ncbi:uncharacterized, partial [Tachysurus ichikawai]
ESGNTVNECFNADAAFLQMTPANNRSFSNWFISLESHFHRNDSEETWRRRSTAAIKHYDKVPSVAVNPLCVYSRPSNSVYSRYKYQEQMGVSLKQVASIVTHCAKAEHNLRVT